MLSLLPAWRCCCRVIICGGGIIGAATAYYLAQLGVAATVIERENLAAAASGKYRATNYDAFWRGHPFACCVPSSMCVQLAAAMVQTVLTTMMAAGYVQVAESDALVGYWTPAGKAGGFLALDWNDGSPVGLLARHSYQLHHKLADVFGRDVIGYREVDTLQVRAYKDKCSF